MPVRDAASTVGRAVASLQRQALRDWELVAVDDGSTDGTAAVLRGLAAADPRVRALGRPAGGIVAALNVGLAAAGGEFIARLDADDEAHPDRLAEQVALLRSDPSLGLVACRVGYGGDAVANAGYALHVAWLNSLVTAEEIALNRFVESPLAHPSVMFRRQLVARHGGYRDGDFPEDYELWLRWLEAGVRMAKVPRELLTWHDLPGRLSRTDPRYSPAAFYRMKAEYIAREVARRGGGEGGSELARDSGYGMSRAGARPQPARDVWVWGAGRPTRQRAAHLGAHGVTIAGYIDVDRKKTGRRVGGVPVIPPDQLPPPGRIVVLGYVASRGARDLIRAELVGRGYVEGRDFLMCA